MADSIGAVFAPGVSIEADWQGMGEGSRRTMLHCAGGLGQDAALFCTCVGGVLAHASKQGAVPVASQHVAQLHSMTSTSACCCSSAAVARRRMSSKQHPIHPLRCL